LNQSICIYRNRDHARMHWQINLCTMLVCKSFDNYSNLSTITLFYRDHYRMTICVTLMIDRLREVAIEF
jgi:hypothetical protein